MEKIKKWIKYLHKISLWVINFIQSAPKMFLWNVIGFLGINTLIKVPEFMIIKYHEFWKSVILIFIFSFLIRSLMVLIYNLIGKDLLWIEEIKTNYLLEIVTEKQNSITKKILKYRRKGEKTLLWGTLFFDPVVAYILYRKGHHVWKITPDIKAFALFTVSVIFCEVELLITTYPIKGIWDPFVGIVTLFWEQPYLLLFFLNLIT